MRETIKKTLITTILFLGLCFSTFGVNADPTVVAIVTDPVNPEPLSTFTVIATIIGDNITSVNAIVSQCSDVAGVCYTNASVSPVTSNADDEYEFQVTLEDDNNKSDHVQYAFVINDNGTSYQLGTLGEYKTYLDLGADNDGSNGDGTDNGSPGFELILLLIAVFILLIYVKRKR